MMSKDWIAKFNTDECATLSELYSDFREEAIQWLSKSYNYDLPTSKDIFQSSVIQLYDNLKSGKLITIRTNIKQYLFGIIRIKSLEYNRLKKEKPISSFNIINHLVIKNSLEDKQELDLNLAKISKTIEMLDEPCRSLLKMFYYERMKYDEIAPILGYKNGSTTKNIKQRCIKKLFAKFTH